MKVAVVFAGLMAAAAVPGGSKVPGAGATDVAVPPQVTMPSSPDAALRLTRGPGQAAVHAGDWQKAFTGARW